MAEVARAWVTIIPSMEGAQETIEKELTGAGSKAGKSAGKSASSSFGSALGKGVKATGVAMAALATGAIAAGTGIYNLASGVAQAGDNIDKMSQKIGISAQAYQEWGYVFERSGASVDNLQAGMKTLSSVITDAASGSEGAAAKLEAVGLSVEDLSNMSQEQQLSTVIEALQGMGEGAERTSAATDLLGKSATDMAAVLNMTGEETQALIDEAHEYGMVMSDDAVAASAAFEDSLTKLDGTVSGFKTSMVSGLLPGITQIVDGLSDLVAGNEGASEAIKSGAESVIGSITEMIPEIVTMISSLASAVMESAPAILEALAQGIVTALPLLVPAAVDMILGLTSTLISMLPMLIDAAMQIILALAEGLIEALPELIPQVVEVVAGIVQALVENASLLIPAAIDLLLALAEGLIAAIPVLIEQAPVIISAVLEAIVSNLPLIITAGIQLIIMLVQGIIQAIPQLIAAVPQVISSLISGFTGALGGILDVGMNIVRGIWSGISNGLGWIKQRITEWVGDVVSFIKRVFKIGSPSKLMRDEVGIFLAKGIGVGFEKGMTDVNKMIKDATSADYRLSMVGTMDSVEAAAAGTLLIEDTPTTGQNIALYIDGIRYNTDDYIDNSITAFVETMVRKQKMYAGA